MAEQIISNEYLNAFVDNQLDASERIRIFEEIRQNEALKDRVCEISGLKEMMQYAYKAPPPVNYKLQNRNHNLSARVQAIAACLLLCLGGISGWMAHTWAGMGTNKELKSFVQSTMPQESNIETRKVIVQVSNSNPHMVKAALDETEALLESYRQNDRKIQMEIVANKDGVNLFRTEFSHQKKRLAMLQDKYPNLKFLVCGQTIGKLRNKGENVQLLPHVGTASSAANQINKRLDEGWGYIRI